MILTEMIGKAKHQQQIQPSEPDEKTVDKNWLHIKYVYTRGKLFAEW